MPATDRPVLLDVTRLLWRRWRGGLPTGVDRVCLAYLERYGPVAQALVQRKGVQITLSHRRSRQLVDLLLTPSSHFRRDLLLFFLGALPSLLRSRPPQQALYLNVGHTGLDEPGLPGWIAAHQLRAIFLVHDLIPITHPHFCRAGEDRRHLRRMRTVLASASGVITNSHATADELGRLARKLGMRMPPVAVAWLSADGLGQPRARPAPDRPYFLVLGTIEARKNHRLLLEVWRGLFERLGEAVPRLVIVGTRGWEAQEVIRQLDQLGPLQGHVVERPRCSDEELAELVAGARALLMPSFAEGFGLPVVEALRLGTAVIATDLPVYREIAGTIPAYLPPDDPASWQETVLHYAGNGRQRQEQLDRLRGFRAPDWPSHFARVDAWLANIP